MYYSLRFVLMFHSMKICLLLTGNGLAAIQSALNASQLMGAPFGFIGSPL